MTPRTAADDEDRQPLLSDTDHEHNHDGQDNARGQSFNNNNNNNNYHNENRTMMASKDMENSHWLDRLVFKTRLRFVISLGVFFVFWVFIVCISSGRTPWDGVRWPWTKDPDYISDVGFWNAARRLQEQPFCYPEVEPLTLKEAGFVHETPSWRSHATWLLDRDFNHLAGSAVLGSVNRHRKRVQAVMSFSEGEPFYERTVEAHDSSAASMTHGTGIVQMFQSRALWEALQSLGLAASDRFRRNVTAQQLLLALDLNQSRIVSVLTRDSHHRAGTVFALETTLSDTQKFVQSLASISHGLTKPSEDLPLDAQVIRQFLSPYVLNTDGSTATTHSPFGLVSKTLVSAGGNALKAVGHNEFKGTQLQRGSRPQHFHVINEFYRDHELSIALDLERGLVISGSAHLGLSQNHKPSYEQDWFSYQPVSIWDWIRSSYGSLQYDLDMRYEDIFKRVSGTYRYQRNNASKVVVDSTAHPEQYDWMEVDVEVGERAFWITRIEYQLVVNNASELTLPVSVLRKYNAGGTADFYAGWTCKFDKKELADCYRPRVGEDDSKCSCRDYRSEVTSSYRVGLWPVSTGTSPGKRVYEIPPNAIRVDTNSYMDQGSGGCLALWSRDDNDDGDNMVRVPEMEALGYKIRLTQPQLSSDGAIIKETAIEWLNGGISLERVSPTHYKW